MEQALTEAQILEMVDIPENETVLVKLYIIDLGGAEWHDMFLHECHPAEVLGNVHKIVSTFDGTDGAPSGSGDIIAYWFPHSDREVIVDIIMAVPREEYDVLKKYIPVLNPYKQ